MSGTKVNLTVHESSEAGDKVMDVRLRLEDAVINIRYIENWTQNFLTIPALPHLIYSKKYSLFSLS